MSSIRVAVVVFFLYALGAVIVAAILPGGASITKQTSYRFLKEVASGSASRSAASAAIMAAPETGTVLLSPQDTYLGLNATNFSTKTTLVTYTWPDYKIANAIVMKFDLSVLLPALSSKRRHSVWRWCKATRSQARHIR